jgi:hypothetical protein
VDDTSAVSVVLSNPSAQRQAFEWGVPAGSWLQVTPRVGQLAPGQSLRLQLEFSPPASLLPPPAAGVAAASPAAAAGPAAAARAAAPAAAPSQQPAHAAAQARGSGAATTANVPSPSGRATPDKQQHAGEDTSGSAGHGSLKEPEALPQARWRQARRWVLPCYVKALGLEEAAGEGSGGPAGAPGHQGDDRDGTRDAAGSGNAEAGRTTSGSGVVVVHLEASVCAVAPELTLDPPGALPRPEGKNYFALDFGALPIGARRLRAVTLANAGGRGAAWWGSARGAGAHGLQPLPCTPTSGRQQRSPPSLC